jgi:hypothetical protein
VTLLPLRLLPVLLLASVVAGCNAPVVVAPAGVPDPDADRSPLSPDGATAGTGGVDVALSPEDVVRPAPADASPGPDAPGCEACAPDQFCLAGRCVNKPGPATPELPPCAAPPCLNVYNNCPIPLWSHAIGTVPIDDGRVRRLNPGEQFQYAGLPPFGGGRLYAYYKEPEAKQDRTRLVSDYNQFVEMTVDTDARGAWAQNYNISYVDYASLPVSMKAVGPGCAETRCGTSFSDWIEMLAHCPTDLRFPHGVVSSCTGSYIYCLTRDASGVHDDTRRYCSKMREAHGFPGSAVYGGVFPDRPATDVAFWDGVAAWNRGTFAGDARDDSYYRTEPYNHYARWIHRDLGCLEVYAFSTDDHQDKAGFVRCSSPRLDVVWCPYRERVVR